MAESEYTRTARDPESRGRLLRLLPIVLAAAAAAPLLWISIEFSLLIGQIGYYVVALGTDAWTILGLGLLTVAGFVGLLGALACLWIAWRRDVWVWRIWWSLGAVVAAGLLPLSWLVLGFTPPA